MLLPFPVHSVCKQKDGGLHLGPKKRLANENSWKFWGSLSGGSQKLVVHAEVRKDGSQRKLLGARLGCQVHRR